MADIELAIKIDDGFLKHIRECVESGDIDYEPWVAIANGTPLDDVKAEIANIDSYKRDGCCVLADVLRVLNNIGKVELELNLENIISESREVTQALNEFADNLEQIEKKYAEPQKSEDTKKNCNTCKNNDDEFSGECYECIKGIFDHYEPKESEDK